MYEVGSEQFLKQEKSYRVAQLQELWQKEQQKISPETQLNAEEDCFSFLEKEIRTGLKRVANIFVCSCDL